MSICNGNNFWWCCREKEEDEALEQARQNKEQENAKQVQKMKIERMREAERRRREAVSTKILQKIRFFTYFLTELLCLNLPNPPLPLCFLPDFQYTVKPLLSGHPQEIAN